MERAPSRTMNANRRIETKLQSLVGLRAWRPGIAAGMLTLSFGQAVTHRSRDRIVTCGELALHIQCSWRLVRSDEVIVGSADYSLIDDEREAINYIGLHLDQTFEGEPCVAEVKYLGAAALRITLNTEVAIEAFPDGSVRHEHYEYWRMFSASSASPHFVVTADRCGLTDG